jgi:hypothetical protein
MGTNEKKSSKADQIDMALRLGTARSADSFGQAIFPVTTNLTADEEVIDPQEERNLDLDAGA